MMQRAIINFFSHNCRNNIKKQCNLFVNKLCRNELRVRTRGNCKYQQNPKVGLRESLVPGLPARSNAWVITANSSNELQIRHSRRDSSLVTFQFMLQHKNCLKILVTQFKNSCSLRCDATNKVGTKAAALNTYCHL